MKSNKRKRFSFGFVLAGLVFLAPVSARADCTTVTMGNKPAGYVFHNADYDVLEVCRSDGTWQAISPTGCPAGDGCPADPCTGSPSPGDVCADGSVYAGLSPDGNVNMYTTPADAGQYTWNNGTSNFIDTAMSNTSYVTGEANTSLLVGLSDAASPYAAAVYCDGLSNVHGQSDWYLPAQDELNVLYTNRAAIGGFNSSGSFPAGYYWSSSENLGSGASTQRFSDGSQLNGGKTSGLSVRCVRR